jgi:hypothetical protein
MVKKSTKNIFRTPLNPLNIQRMSSGKKKTFQALPQLFALHSSPFSSAQDGFKN